MTEPDYRINDFSISRLFSRAMESFRQNAGLAVVATLLFLIVQSAAGGATMGLSSLLLYGPITAGYSYFMLRVARGGRADLADMLVPLQQDPIQTIILGALLVVFYGIGFALCILPGFVVMFFYMLAFFFFVDRRMPAWDAMEASRKAVMQDPGNWVLLLLVVAALNIAGALLCLVGLLITAPLATLMTAAAYDELIGATVPPEPDAFGDETYPES